MDLPPHGTHTFAKQYFTSFTLFGEILMKELSTLLNLTASYSLFLSVLKYWLFVCFWSFMTKGLCPNQGLLLLITVCSEHRIIST